MEKTIKVIGEDVQISDGYHTFEELYDHRFTLFIALCRQKKDHWLMPNPNNRSGLKDRAVWRSKLHSDGTMYDGMFILGIGKEPGKQITYHLDMDRWDETNFAETRDNAPEWDGHTSADGLERLKAL